MSDNNYEKKRENMLYYKKTLTIIEYLRENNNLESIIDIGGWQGGFISKTKFPKKKLF